MWLDEKHYELKDSDEHDSILECGGRDAALERSHLSLTCWNDPKRRRSRPGKIAAALQDLTAIRTVRAWCARLMLLLLCFFAGGCATITLPPVNLKQPGWTIRQGQAIWHRQRGGEGIAGDILVATRPDGRAFVQFSKTPFPLVVAQSTPRAWTAEFPPENKHYSGRGRPPERIIFLQLPRVLSGQPPPRNWSWRQLAGGGWRLENNASGESLDVYFNP